MRTLPLVFVLFIMPGCKCSDAPPPDTKPEPARGAVTPATSGGAIRPRGTLADQFKKGRALPIQRRDPPPAAPADLAAPPADAKATASGLKTKQLSKGTGTKKPKDPVRDKINYSGWTKDGRLFDSTVTRGQPAVLPLDAVVKGFGEGLKLMVEGEKRRLWIPKALAYGDRPQMGAPAGDLVFDVELLEIVEPPAVPKDLKAPPKTAKKTASGLAYQVLQAGKGTRSPSLSDRVTVHYSGWTTDGKMFDSSVARGQPASFSVSGVIKGWTEGLQLMKEGDKMRFWIPAELAYGENPGPGRPGGMLVFEVELLSIASPR